MPLHDRERHSLLVGENQSREPYLCGEQIRFGPSALYSCKRTGLIVERMMTKEKRRTLSDVGPSESFSDRVFVSFRPGRCRRIGIE